MGGCVERCLCGLMTFILAHHSQPNQPTNPVPIFIFHYFLLLLLPYVTSLPFDSACGDGGGRVRIWRFPEDISCFTSSSELKGEISTPPEPIPPLFVHDGDVYSVNFCHPDPSRLITAGHDRLSCCV